MARGREHGLHIFLQLKLKGQSKTPDRFMERNRGFSVAVGGFVSTGLKDTVRAPVLGSPQSPCVPHFDRNTGASALFHHGKVRASDKTQQNRISGISPVIIRAQATRVPGLAPDCQASVRPYFFLTKWMTARKSRGSAVLHHSLSRFPYLPVAP